MIGGPMTREEHLEWAKARALAYMDRGDPADALASILSDLSKHDETAGMARRLNFHAFRAYMADELRGWIEGLR